MDRWRRPRRTPPERTVDAAADDGLWAPVKPGASMLVVVASGATGGATLPDDVPQDPEAITFAPGAMIGILSQHAPDATAENADLSARAVVTALDRHSQGQLDRATLLAMYESLVQAELGLRSTLFAAVLDWGQAAMTERPQQGANLEAAITAISGWLIEAATERRPVQAGILLASLLKDLGGHEQAIATLGRHAEFAFEACTALGRGGEQYESLLYDLGRRHTGWGRIHAVEYLSRSADQDVRRWLLEDGFRNDVMWEYTTCQVAVRCDLAGELETLCEDLPAGAHDSHPPPEAVALLDGARDILSTLLQRGSPAGDIQDYAEAGAATTAWLQAIGVREPSSLTIEDFDLALELTRAVEDDERLDDDNGFSQSVRADVRDRCRALLSDPCVPAVAISSLTSPDGRSLFAGTRVAEAIGLETVTTHLARVRVDPDDTATWWQLTQHANDRADEVVRAALELLPEDCVARSSRATIGPGPGPHMAVTFLLQQLVARRPGTGWLLLERCLRSPLVGPRNQALTTLLAWPRSFWPQEAPELLRQVLAGEEDERLRSRLMDVVNDTN